MNMMGWVAEEGKGYMRGGGYQGGGMEQCEGPTINAST
jgi:hypothetical protein